MASVISLGTNQNPWYLLAELGQTSLSNPQDYAAASSFVPGTKGFLITPLPDANTFAFEFYGTALDNDTATARIWLVFPVGTSPGVLASEYAGTYVGELALTFGAALGASSTTPLYLKEVRGHYLTYVGLLPHAARLAHRGWRRQRDGPGAVRLDGRLGRHH